MGGEWEMNTYRLFIGGKPRRKDTTGKAKTYVGE
jgi:hypothetical protein